MSKITKYIKQQFEIIKELTDDVNLQIELNGYIAELNILENKNG